MSEVDLRDRLPQWPGQGEIRRPGRLARLPWRYQERRAVGELPGEANPIAGSDIAFNGALIGHFVGSDAWCGDMEGALTSPLEADLSGSNFAAIRVPSPAALPDSFPYRCDMLP
ncbi:hypothetical protein [Enhygromyxa salina]|uniref:hypothetical protein n=1 Tax=Enhygromyxa salina TaxID=215803 RepID=UPI0011BAD34A|nr:hypothetical protein [Enhygromyxa salina]